MKDALVLERIQWHQWTAAEISADGPQKKGGLSEYTLLGLVALAA